MQLKNLTLDTIFFWLQNDIMAAILFYLLNLRKIIITFVTFRMKSTQLYSALHIKSIKLILVKNIHATRQKSFLIQKNNFPRFQNA